MDADGLRLFFCQALADRKKSFGRLKRRPYRIPESLFLFGVFVVIHQIEYFLGFLSESLPSPSQQLFACCSRRRRGRPARSCRRVSVNARVQDHSNLIRTSQF